MLALFTLAAVIVVVEEVFVVVFVVPVDGHAHQSNQRADVERRLFFTIRVFRPADGASTKEHRGKTA